jgi:hypothetical protein
MSDNEEERRVKARHDVTHFFQRRKLVSRRELPRADMTIEGEPSVAREEERSEDDDVEDDTVGAHKTPISCANILSKCMK